MFIFDIYAHMRNLKIPDSGGQVGVRSADQSAQIGSDKRDNAKRGLGCKAAFCVLRARSAGQVHCQLMEIFFPFCAQSVRYKLIRV